MFLNPDTRAGVLACTCHWHHKSEGRSTHHQPELRHETSGPRQKTLPLACCRKVGSSVTPVCCGPGATRTEEVVKVRQVEGSDIYVEGLDFAICRRTGVAIVTPQPGMLVMLGDVASI